ncbi:pectinesterase family protein [Rheinheimera hassiensis]|uniref:pectinesterase family protein n=1 Tax=Rheinheimera hassiensis TaxID=1193627 RepID=UPI001F0701E2|nr:pectinesterase family protein [Rheinheimera hassiensis]
MAEQPSRLNVLPRHRLLLVFFFLAQCCSFVVGAEQPQNLQHYSDYKYPDYKCQQGSTGYCQSFEQLATGLTFFSATDAPAGQPNGKLTVHSQRHSLQFKAGRIGGHLLQVDAKALHNVDMNDFFYEVLLRPYANSTTDRETLYLTLKDSNSDRYYAAGLKVGSSVYTSKLELGIVQDNKVQVLAEKALPIVLGAQDDVDGQWYLLRLERRGGMLKVYLNSELLLSDDSIGDTRLQQPGIWSYNRSFELDYLQVGNGELTTPHIDLQQHENQPLVGYQHEQSQPVQWQVSGGAAQDIVLKNLSPSVVKLLPQNGSFILQYLQPGQGSVLLQSKSQPHIFKQLHIRVLPALQFPAKTAATLLDSAYPPRNSRVSADTLLRLTFEQDINLADNGAVRIYQLENGKPTALVDEIKAGPEIDAFGSLRDNKYRSLNRRLIWSSGNTLLIKPHSGKLEPGKQYQVRVSAGLVSYHNDTAPFLGVGADADWRFSVKPAPAANAVMHVAADGSADFNTLQGALDFVMSAADGDKVEKIKLAAGVYHEPLYLYGVKNLTIEGAGASQSHIEFTNYDSLNSGLGLGFNIVAGHSAGGRSVFMVEDVAQLVLKQLSIKNLHQRREGVRNQAETLYFNSNGKLIVTDSVFVSEQDTLMLKGLSYFYRCLIAGNVDFIWGQNYLSLFEQNEIRSVGNSVKNPGSEYAEGSYILQARTISEDAPGFIFINNRFTSAAGPTGNRIRPGSTFIARSAGREMYVDNVLMLNNQLDNHIGAQGWAGPVNHEPLANPVMPGVNAGWREYGSVDLQGKPLDFTGRKYGRVLTAEELPFKNSRAILQRYWPDFDYALLNSK